MSNTKRDTNDIIQNVAKTTADQTNAEFFQKLKLNTNEGTPMAAKETILTAIDNAPTEDLYDIAIEAICTLLDNREGDYKRFVTELRDTNETVYEELEAWFEDLYEDKDKTTPTEGP